MREFKHEIYYLEKKVKYLTYGCIGFAALATVVFAYNLIWPSEIRTGRVSIVNNQGVEVASFGVVRNKPVLQFVENKKSLAKIGLSPKGSPFLNFYGEKRKPKITLGLQKKTEPYLTFKDLRGTPRLQLSVRKNGKPTVNTYNERGRFISNAAD